MRYDSPLCKRHEEYVRQGRPDPNVEAHRPGAAHGVRIAAPSVAYITYGPADVQGHALCKVAATFGDLESEYAAIRKGAGLLDSPHRGTICVTGDDRRDFLNRMLTQELKDLEAGIVKQTFWLNRKGRIEADLLLMDLGDRLLVDLDIHQVEHTVKTLGEFQFTEDVDISDAGGDVHHLAVHGPQAEAVVAAAAGGDASFHLDPLRTTTVQIAGVEVVVARRDLTGEVGLELIAPRDRVEAVWDALLATDETIGMGKRRVRPAGWHAVNIARIEAGTPLFNIDFGSTNLPHETGILSQRVSFTKGCYLGQEIVARTESLGRPKQMLVGLRMAGDLLPEAGAQVFTQGGDTSGGGMGPQVGVVTSSTLSPMLGAVPIAFAMLKTDHAEPGTTVLVNAEGDQTDAAVCALCFLNPESTAREAK